MDWKITAITTAILLFIVGLLTGLSLSQPIVLAQEVIPVQEVVIETPEEPETHEVPESNDGYGIERQSPSDRIKEDQIYVYNDEVVIKVENAVWATFTDTNSMDPVLDDGANAIQVVPKSQSEIKVGDIISFESRVGPIIHRVVKISYDEEGWYATTKGDNNPEPDPVKVRFEDIRRVLVAIIY